MATAALLTSAVWKTKSHREVKSGPEATQPSVRKEATDSFVQLSLKQMETRLEKSRVVYTGLEREAEPA